MFPLMKVKMEEEQTAVWREFGSGQEQYLHNRKIQSTWMGRLSPVE
jgi:exosome complex RNA-binding protein Csl4